MIVIYNIFFTIFFLPVILILSAFSKKIRSGSLQKFGKYDFNFSDIPNIVWIHAISVGEVQLMENVIKNLKGFEIVLTTSTPQGQELAQKNLSDHCKKITYFPYDFSISVNNAFKAINPRFVLIAETEIWPNFSHTAKKLNVPVIIVNGRISERTFKTYKRLKFFFKEILKNYFAILVQSEDDKKRFIEIGANPLVTSVMGNMKFDIEKPDIQISDLNLGKNRLIIAGSTHNGEDEIILKTYNNLKKRFPDLKLLIAPRHMERVCALRSITGCCLKSQGDFKDNDILILDTTGELKNLYSLAHSAFIGGSFNKTGGHNPLEAIIWGVPVLSGSNVKNFRLIYKILSELNCAKILKTQQELEAEFAKLLSDNDHYENAQKNCREVFEKNRGAAKYLFDFIEKKVKNGN